MKKTSFPPIKQTQKLRFFDNLQLFFVAVAWFIMKRLGEIFII